MCNRFLTLSLQEMRDLENQDTTGLSEGDVKSLLCSGQSYDHFTLEHGRDPSNLCNLMSEDDTSESLDFESR